MKELIAEIEHERSRFTRHPTRVIRPMFSVDLKPVPSAEWGTYVLHMPRTFCFKVGRTRNIDKRMATFNDYLPVAVDLVAWWPRLDCESVMLGLARGYGRRLRGEWVEFAEDAYLKFLERGIPIAQSMYPMHLVGADVGCFQGPRWPR